MHVITVLKPEAQKKRLPSRFQRHASTLLWKCYLQRQRRWKILLVEAVFAFLVFVASIFIAKPVFLTTLQDEPEAPLSTIDILASLKDRNILGYAPNIEPYVAVMDRASNILGIEIINAATESDLNEILYNHSDSEPLKTTVIWVIWKPKEDYVWRLSIRSTQRARYVTSEKNRETSNPHLRAGFLAVQVAISMSIIEYTSPDPPEYEIYLVSMPVSPLMEENRVRLALSGILLCFTLAFIPPVLEIEALVLTETLNNFKRAIRMRNVSYSSMYVGWLGYAYLTVLPVCVLGSITLILIFRWINLLAAWFVLLAYVSVMVMVSFLMSMFHNKVISACVWTTLFTLLQTYLAELLIHHQYDMKHNVLTIFFNLILPPMGLVNALNKYALLQTGRRSGGEITSLIYMVALWVLMNVFYFGILMMLQQTIGRNRALGGQVSWKSIIFKKVKDHNKLHAIKSPSGFKIGKLQEVDEFVAKAISFRDVSKSIMEVPTLSNLTFDIYRGEFTILYTKRIQKHMINTIDDLVTGLTFADEGTITVLGLKLERGTEVMNSPHMMGYCHNADTLVDDLTVEEHFTLFTMICLWSRKEMNIYEYYNIRSKQLLNECDLESVKFERVKNLNIYYKAQLCWAIALLLEPRIVILPFFVYDPLFMAVIKDKIMQYKKYVTILAYYYSSHHMEYADRIFIFDSNVLVFGGTPAYMFFMYGRDYVVRIALKRGGIYEEKTDELIDRAIQAGAKVRAYLGSFLILRLPTHPTSTVAAFVNDITENARRYGITSFNISVPDCEEVCKRALKDWKSPSGCNPFSCVKSKQALMNIAGPVKWKRRTSRYNIHLTHILWKFITFYLSNKLVLAVTLISAMIAGITFGISLSTVLVHMDPNRGAEKILSDKIQRLSVENLQTSTTLVVRADNTSAAQSIAAGYVMSDTKATELDIKHMEYTALPHTESLTDYLVTRAIDSPQLYVYKYAYGMDVEADANGKVTVEALYSPVHQDHSAAARSLARVFMALIRHYSGFLDASIHIDDDPLALGLSPIKKDATTPPLFIQFLLILTSAHIPLMPSREFGIIGHVQKHAMNFSPMRYWFTLYFCDLLLYWILVSIMAVIMITIIILMISMQHIQPVDLLIVPFMLMIYGIACVPQAYVFSLGPRVALNAMTFIIVNLVFGETTIIARIFYGDTLKYTLEFMSLSPQFNMAYAYVKIKRIFLYNNECVIVKLKNVCSVNAFHKCCQKCGVLQECFSRKSYFNRNSGLLMEVLAMLMTAATFTTLLLLIEYRVFIRIWTAATSILANRDKPTDQPLMPGAEREKGDALEKKIQLEGSRTTAQVVTFGEYLLVTDLTKRYDHEYAVHNVWLGLRKGDVVALVGLKRMGRDLLFSMLAGYAAPCGGNVRSMSQWKLKSQPHMYCRQVSFSCSRTPLPPWMRVKDALELIAVLRGLPRKYVQQELKDYIHALELDSQAKSYISDITPIERARLNFAVAVIGAPPIIVLNEFTVYQKGTVTRAMYFILYTLRKRGHAIYISSSRIETHMPVTKHLAIFKDGRIYDVDTVEKLVERYGKKGYTVVVHLKDEVDVIKMFAQYFRDFTINDTSEVLVNVQVLDEDLSWVAIFDKMEALQKDNKEVYSYIVTVVPIDYVYHTIISDEQGTEPAKGLFSWKWPMKLMSSKPEVKPAQEVLDKLIPLEQKYDITTLKELPWSVIFHR